MRLLRSPDFRYPAILAVLSVLLWAPRLHGPIDLRWDAGVYYILGTSLAEGNGYRLSNEPGNITAVQYPPLLPMLVAGEEKFLGTKNTDLIASWLRRTYCLMFIGYIVGSYALARQIFRPEYAFLVGLICALSGDMLYLSDLLQAELPFALVTVLFVICARPFAKKSPDEPEKKSPGERPWRFISASFLAIAACLLRSSGIALTSAWVGEAVFRRRWRAVALRTIVALIPVVTWQGYVSHIRHGDEYRHPTYAYQRAPYQYYNVSYAENLLLLDSFKPELGNISVLSFAKRAALNLPWMIPRIGEAVSSSKAFVYWTVDAANRRFNLPAGNWLLPGGLATIVVDGVGIVTILGIGLMAFRRQWFLVFYLGATIFLICITPWPRQFLRYLSTAVPFLALCTVAMITAPIQLLAAQRDLMLRRIGTLICASLLVSIPVMEAVVCWFTFRAQHSPPGSGAAPLFYMRQDWISWGGAIEWLNENSSPSDVIATSAPHLAYLRTGRRSVLPPMEADSDRALQLLDSVPVRFLVVASFDFLNIDNDYVVPMLSAHPEAWRLVYTTSDKLTHVYERVPAGSNIPAGAQTGGLQEHPPLG